MDNFYIALITCSSIIVAFVSSFVMFHINTIKSKRDKALHLYKSDCLLLSRFLQLCHALERQRTYSNRDCKIDEDAQDCLPLYNAVNSLVSTLGNDAFEKYPHKEYTRSWLNDNVDNVNKLWYFLIHKRNRINAYKKGQFTLFAFPNEMTKEILTDLSFGNHYTELNYETVGSIAGDVECTLIPRMRKMLNTINESVMSNEFKCIIVAILILIITDCIFPILFILLNINKVWIGVLQFAVLLALIAYIVNQLHKWYKNIFISYK
jgi:hypothetical protein